MFNKAVIIIIFTTDSPIARPTNRPIKQVQADKKLNRTAYLIFIPALSRTAKSPVQWMYFYRVQWNYYRVQWMYFYRVQWNYYRVQWMYYYLIIGFNVYIIIDFNGYVFIGF